LVTGGSPSQPGKSPLSRLVRVSSRPAMLQRPFDRRPSSAASSSGVGGSHEAGPSSATSACSASCRSATGPPGLRRPRRWCSRCAPSAGAPPGPSRPPRGRRSCAPSATAHGRARSRAGPARSGRRACPRAGAGGSPRRRWPRPGRRCPPEVDVLHGMVLDANGGVAGLRVQRRPPRYGPADEHAVELEAEVVVQAPGAMALHDEPMPAPLSRSTGGLGGPGEVALAAVGLEGHAGGRSRGPCPSSTRSDLFPMCRSGHPPGKDQSRRRGLS
jgi:hypothetical protein